MNKTLIAMLAGLCVMTASATTLAKEHGGQHGKHDDMPMSTHGAQNTNGLNSGDQDKGQARADERRNDNATGKSRDQKQGKKGQGKKEPGQSN